MYISIESDTVVKAIVYNYMLSQMISFENDVCYYFQIFFFISIIDTVLVSVTDALYIYIYSRRIFFTS